MNGGLRRIRRLLSLEKSATGPRTEQFVEGPDQATGSSMVNHGDPGDFGAEV